MSEPVSPPRLRLVALFSLSLLLPLAGCDRNGFLKVVGYDRAKLLRKMVSQNDETLGRQYVESLRQHRFEQIEGDLEPNLKTPDIRQTLADMAQLFPLGELLSTKPVDAHVVHHGESSRTSALTFEYEFKRAAMPTNENVGLTPRVWLLT